MSVLVPDHEIFNHLYSAMVHSAISTTVDIRYSYVMSRHMNNHTDKHCEMERNIKNDKPEAPTTTREQRRQIRLDKAARRYAKKVQQGKKTVRYY